jgi:hypothetical protein
MTLPSTLWLPLTLLFKVIECQNHSVKSSAYLPLMRFTLHRQASRFANELPGICLTAAPWRGVIFGNMRSRSISDVLRAAIRESGIPLLQLQNATGVHRASISRFLSGARSMHLDIADKLAERLGLELRTVKPTAKRK